MPLELRLAFSGSAHVAIALHGKTEEYSPSAAFASPLNEKDMAELRWYVEDYGSGYRAEPDDARAAAVRDKLPVWGAELFSAVFRSNNKAGELFRRFLEAEEEGRVLSIAADHPAVLSLPWELLSAPGCSFLFNEQPRISIRRGLPAAKQECAPQPHVAKPVLHLLFIISRPDGAGFLHPRSDAQAVLNALEQQKQVRVEVEFLRLATLAELKKRLLDSTKAPVDIIHFDGHGVLAGGGADDRKQGWLLFEGEWGGTKKVSGKAFGELLNSNHTSLVVLSACQSAMMDSEDPMSGVAAQLVHAGIPAVIAMSYSALVATTEQLFAEFYRSLFEGRSVASSLDEARHALRSNPERGTRLRGAHNAQEVTLELHDWFLPALYQSGSDMALLSAAADESLLLNAAPLHNLPDVQESGFFGRSWELWQIERFFAVNHCRRISITGFGGQGKTALACEAGRWLLRTRLFQRACLVRFDSYQGSDPVSMAVSTMSAVFQESLLDVAAAQASLENTATLLILDNLESLTDGGNQAELLNAAAKWSEAGASRVLLTSRQPDFQHSAYPLTGSYDHRHIALQGLREDDAVDWFDEMYRLPPEAKQPRPQRDVLVRLFEQVGFHPLSISLLAQQLKERGPADVGGLLEALLALQPLNREDRSLLASLELSIERLPERCKKWLPRLGVFQGGGLEEIVVKVAGMEDYPSEWSVLRYHLLLSGLMQEERLPENTFLRFHPTLTSHLWLKLCQEEQAVLTERHCQAYYQLSGALYWQKNKNRYLAHATIQHELKNLLSAVYSYLQTSRAKEDMYIALTVTSFLNEFGMQRDWQMLVDAILKVNSTVGSYAWFAIRFNIGDQLLYSSLTKAAEQLFQDILTGLNGDVSYNRCLTLSKLAKCCENQMQLTDAEKFYRQTLYELSLIEQTYEVRNLTRGVHAMISEMMRMQGRERESHEAYNNILSTTVDKEPINEGLTVKDVYDYFNSLTYTATGITNDPLLTAYSYYQKGIDYQNKEDLEAAEQAYRKSVQQYEKLDVRGKLGDAWGQIAILCVATNRLKEAEMWFRKALAVSKNEEKRDSVYGILQKLSVLIAQDQERLAEAICLAEESLSIAVSLDPSATELWKSYELLAQLTSQQGNSSQAAAYRAKSRRAYFACPSWRQQVQQHGLLITAAQNPVRFTEEAIKSAEAAGALVKQMWNLYDTATDTYNGLAIAADQEGDRSRAAEYRAEAHVYFQKAQEEMRTYEKLIAEARQNSDIEFILACCDEVGANLKAAIRLLLSGARDEAALIEPLNYEEAAIIRAILEGIAGKG